LRSVRLGDVAVVALLVDLPVLDDDPLGSGVLVAPGHPSVRAKALTHASAKWDWVRERIGPPRHVVRLSYGRDGTLAEQVDALPANAAADLAALLGRESVAVERSAVARWPRTLVRPMPGHRATAAAIVDAATAAPNLAVVGAGLGGNSLAGTIAVSRGVVAQLTS
jgi:oxygen-dependent protoporphyrinogen oxidase